MKACLTADRDYDATKMLIVQKAGICKHLYINISDRSSLVDLMGVGPKPYKMNSGSPLWLLPEAVQMKACLSADRDCDATKMLIVQKAGICKHVYFNTLEGSSLVVRMLNSDPSTWPTK